MSIAQAIKHYRYKQGLTQADLADRIGRTTRSVKRYEKGSTIPSIEILEKIFVGVDIQKLIYMKILEVNR